MSPAPLHLGVDVGTQGVRAVLVRSDGAVVARAGRPLPPLPTGPVQEQRPEDWWDAVVGSIRDLGDHRAHVAAVAFSCTSGSLCALDADGAPVAPALLYSDRRAVPTSDDDASWAVAKLRWLTDARPDLVARTTRFTSPGGYLTGRLLGRPAAIDETQALKFGYDPQRCAWGTLPVAETALPRVVPTGSLLGRLAADAARATGLAEGAVVVAGATDGVAAQLACRPAPDRWVTTIGSTIVWKTMAPTRVVCAHHGIYSHRGPEGWWLPGAASNAGARILASWATPDDLAVHAAAAEITPATPPAYPSVLRGERFPFVDPDFEPWACAVVTGPERYAAEALGLAFVERWGYEALVAHGCAPPTVIATTGGAVAAASLTRLRADVLDLPVEVPAEPSSAFGAAVIAAAPTHGGVLAAADAMVRIAERVEPNMDGTDWTPAYRAFRERCTERRVGAA